MRPILDTNLTADEFQKHYWLREELEAFCKEHGINYSGGKIDLADRVIHYLKTGSAKFPRKYSKTPVSKFDWATEKLTPDTIITDSYKNSENVRAFFKRQIGEHYKFNTEFMNWMKSNAGRRLSDAAEAWEQIRVRQKDPLYKSEIAPQFEYNKYIRELLKDNPGLTVKEAIICWKEKRKLPVPKRYDRDDLRFIL